MDLSKTYVIHEPDVHFDVKFNIEGLLADTTMKTSTAKGELYVSEGSLYLGHNETWYKMTISDIKEILSVSETKKIELIFNCFSISLFTDDYSHLNALRDILYIVQSRMRSKDKKAKVRRGVAN